MHADGLAPHFEDWKITWHFMNLVMSIPRVTTFGLKTSHKKEKGVQDNLHSSLEELLNTVCFLITF